MTKIKKNGHTKCWQGGGEAEALTHCSWKCKMIQPLWKTAWQHLKKLIMLLPYMIQTFYSSVFTQENLKLIPIQRLVYEYL